MDINFEEAILKGAVIKILERNYVEVTRELSSNITKLLTKLDFNEEHINILKHLIEEVADSSYRLGAERQKQATFYNVHRVIKELENK